ncbi:hypothetical protein JZ751_010079 [Albula glossodonta]|uniref:BING4 C-terminal domain-containing protein n=1 Tax=Albula glossodonta TaxID=121402 RepID=A0A8T2N2Y6_9TELE|nr:hypothetical protein JZ751_010079 [Albula glossodonta]
MAAHDDAELERAHVEKKKTATKRYWDSTEEKGKEDGDKEGEKEGKEGETEKKLEGGTSVVEKKKKKNGPGKQRGISGKVDPFPGSAPISEQKLKRFQRGKQAKMSSETRARLKDHLKRSEAASEFAQKQAARFDLLLPEDAGLRLKVASVSAVLTSTGRSFYHRGVKTESMNGVLNSSSATLGLTGASKWLHSEAMFAVAQKKWLYIYDNNGIELHCIRKFNDVLRMQFLPYHFLLATASTTGFLQYLDVSVGKEVAAICTKAGRLDVMALNSQNAIVHLGHPTGTVTLWSPNQKEPLVKMLCHRGGVRSIAVDKTGTYMVTSGLDKRLKVFDIRAFRPLHSYFLPAGASCLSLSQRGLLCASTGNIVQVYQDVCNTPVKKPYMAHRVRGSVWGAQFCPFEDVLGVGHAEGFTSMLIPVQWSKLGWLTPYRTLARLANCCLTKGQEMQGRERGEDMQQGAQAGFKTGPLRWHALYRISYRSAGEPNFDGLDANPYRSVKQRQDWEVRALLEKIQPELIGLHPEQLAQVDRATWEQRHHDKVQHLCGKAVSVSSTHEWGETRFEPLRVVRPFMKHGVAQRGAVLAGTVIFASPFTAGSLGLPVLCCTLGPLLPVCAARGAPCLCCAWCSLSVLRVVLFECARGYDPLAKEKFIPRLKTKGRSSTGKVQKRKKQVAHEDQRDQIREVVGKRLEKERQKKMEKKTADQGQRSALDRFRK